MNPDMVVFWIVVERHDFGAKTAAISIRSSPFMYGASFIMMVVPTC